MPSVTVTYPAAVAPDLLAGFEDRYPDLWVQAQATGKTPPQFIQSVFVAISESVYRDWKIKQATPAAPAPAGVT